MGPKFYKLEGRDRQVQRNELLLIDWTYWKIFLKWLIIFILFISYNCNKNISYKYCYKYSGVQIPRQDKLRTTQPTHENINTYRYNGVHIPRQDKLRTIHQQRTNHHQTRSCLSLARASGRYSKAPAPSPVPTRSSQRFFLLFMLWLMHLLCLLCGCSCIWCFCCLWL